VNILDYLNGKFNTPNAPENEFKGAFFSGSGKKLWFSGTIF
jgi:hypothetical protein